MKSSATPLEQQTAYANYLAAATTLNSAQAQESILRAQMYTAWKTYTDLATNDTYETSEGKPKDIERTAAEFQIAKDTWLAAEKQFTDQETAIAASAAQVQALWLVYKATQNETATSPAAGTVANISVIPGKSVQAMTAHTPIVSPVLFIITNEKSEVLLPISQTNITKVKEGQEVTIFPDAYKDKTYKGKVARVDGLGEIVEGVVTYNAYVDVINSDEKLRSDMTVDAEIVTNTSKNTLSVPNAAVVQYRGQQAVRVPGKNNSITYKFVITGIKGETRTQVLDGISEGENIIVSLTNEKAERPGFMGL